MSFLQDLNKFDANRLRPTTTTVMTSDGRRLCEIRDKSGNYTHELVGNDLGFVGDYKPDLQVGTVLPGLLIGSHDVASNKALLEEHKVTHILNLAPGIEPSYPTEFTYLDVPILDLPDTHLPQYFPACFRFIEHAQSKNGCVLVHCNAGVSRSAALVIAFVMISEKLDYESAYTMVKAARPAIQPNVGFIQQLKQYKPDIK